MSLLTSFCQYKVVYIFQSTRKVTVNCILFDLCSSKANHLFLLLQVLGELMGDKSLEKFRVEYEKLHRALKKSHESEKRLMQKCRELNAEIVANASKVQTALKLSQEDQTTIASLKKVTVNELTNKTQQNQLPAALLLT